MSIKNIFAGYSVRSEFVNLIYKELMKREFVSYVDVLALFCGRPKGYYDKIACNSEPGYGELKKAFPEVLKALTKIIPDSIEDNGQSKGKAYRYIEDRITQITSDYDQASLAYRDAVSVAHRQNESSENTIKKANESLKLLQETNTQIGNLLEAFNERQDNVETLISHIHEMGSAIEALQKLEIQLKRLSK